MTRSTVAVIGAGVSGLTAAHVLSTAREVTLFEADDRLGGHAHTHDVPAGDRTVPVDSGFIVHNERTYPQLLRLFAELGVETRPTEMSMSITCTSCGLSYAGGRGLRGVLAQPWRAADPRFVRLLTEVPRFHRDARRLLATAGPEVTWGQFLADGGYSDHFVRHFAVPLVSCVWSSGDQDALAYPARHLFAFLEHHGMLTVTGSPTWKTVVGGSRTYVERLAARLPDVRRGTPVTSVIRHDDGVDVITADGSTQTFDQVVLATHADQALAVLGDATPEEKDDLGAITYSVNRTLLHRDPALLPARRAARASWNHRTSCGPGTVEDGVTVSYWMNRLQGLDVADDLVVTLNGAELVDPDTVVAEMTYAHPVFTTAAVEAAQRLRAAGGDRLAFAGAHLGWGFHEDGCRSGVEAAARLGVTW
ncbi:NAD(P)/FAD-dependent oxidoreductase [Nocardioides caricicola]|uniref:NAD(P)/FAD-dependent oxidoreductase n=1 Tax=Nocardioides caricicola TaxID=634770 RepID=A0ABW0MY98_9ACTN